MRGEGERGERKRRERDEGEVEREGGKGKGEKKGKEGRGRKKREREKRIHNTKFYPQTCVTIKLNVHVQHVTYTLVMSFLFLKSFKLSSDKFPLPLPSSREDSNSLTVSVTESTYKIIIITFIINFT